MTLCVALALLAFFAGRANATLYAQTVRLNSGTQTTIHFDPSVTKTWVLMSGFDVQFNHGKDLRRIEVSAFGSPTASPNQVKVGAVAMFKGESKQANGWVDITVIGQTEDDMHRFKYVNWSKGDGQVEAKANNTQGGLREVLVFLRSFKVQHTGSHAIRSVNVDTGGGAVDFTSSPDWSAAFKPTLNFDSGKHGKIEAKSMGTLVMFLPLQFRPDQCPDPPGNCRELADLQVFPVEVQDLAVILKLDLSMKATLHKPEYGKNIADGGVDLDGYKRSQITGSQVGGWNHPVQWAIGGIQRFEARYDGEHKVQKLKVMGRADNNPNADNSINATFGVHMKDGRPNARDRHAGGAELVKLVAYVGPYWDG